jgi:hypothetical protein
MLSMSLLAGVVTETFGVPDISNSGRFRLMLGAGQGLRVRSATITGFTTPPILHCGRADFGLRGNTRRAIQAYRLPLTFIIYKKEGLVFNNAAAERIAELVVQRRLWLWAEIEEISRAEIRVGEIFQQRAVRRIRA